MEFFEQSDLLVEGEGVYACYRTPAVIKTAKGSILAFCEGRRDSAKDTGQIDILVGRSEDGGKTFGEFHVVATQKRWTCGNPAPVLDIANGTVLLLFCKNKAKDDEKAILEGKGERTVWVTSSTDDGVTWSEPQEITKQVKQAEWSWYATGPGHGIQLQNGRIVVPCNHVVKGTGDAAHDPHHSHIIYSDDHGKNWKIGGKTDQGTNESTILESTDGKLCLNSRNHPPLQDAQNFRAVSWSTDYGMSFSPAVHDAYLPEPGCQGSVVRLSSTLEAAINRVLFCNPAGPTTHYWTGMIWQSSTVGLGGTEPGHQASADYLNPNYLERKNLTVRVSYDECRTWPVSRAVNSGFSAYSDLCVAADGSICVFYERGEKGPYEKLTFTRFNLDWLSGGRDTITTDLEEI